MSQIILAGRTRLASTQLDIPYAEVMVRAGLSGFASPAEDYAAKSLDMNQRFIKHPAASFIFRVLGDSMEEYRIFEGDHLVVDRSINPRPGHIVIALVEGELTVKKWIQQPNGQFLCSGGDRYPPIHMNDTDIQIWGVVRSGHVEFQI